MSTVPNLWNDGMQHAATWRGGCSFISYQIAAVLDPVRGKARDGQYLSVTILFFSQEL